MVGHCQDGTALDPAAGAKDGSAGSGTAGSGRVALVGTPNAGKTSLFNGLTGLRTRTGNYPGVTVSRYVGRCTVGAARYTVEDLPGTYSLEPVSPDEQVVLDVIDGTAPGAVGPDALVFVVDATTLRRSMGFLAEVLARARPTCVVVTFTDELVRRQGALDVDALATALGVPTLAVVAHRAQGLDDLRAELRRWDRWARPPVPPPVDGPELDSWAESVLGAAGYAPPRPDVLTGRVDAVLLHPVWGTAIFLGVMFAFFQTIFTLAAPAQDAVESVFTWLGAAVAGSVTTPWLAGLLGDAVIGGVGGVLVFVPQIALLFTLLAVIEGTGYMARAAFLMDRVMARFGLEGRAFVALLSSFACAVPGIMATRSLPSARDRVATMMGAPLMTCSARLPVYVMLIGLLVPSGSRVGPFPAQGTVMFALYLLGAVSAVLTTALFRRIGSRRSPAAPFYLEMPTYRMPSARSVALAVAESVKAFLRKCTTVILGTAVALWVLLNATVPGAGGPEAAGVDLRDPTAVTAWRVDHSVAAGLGRAVGPVFEPLGFDWRINVGVLSSLGARETFVATMGQVAAAENPEEPVEALRGMTYDDGPRAGERVFGPGTVAALVIFFVYALQCMSTVAAIRRETGRWRWGLVAWAYMFALAWGAAFVARTLAVAVVG